MVNDFRVVATNVPVMKGEIAELTGLISKHGLEVLPGPVKTRMQSVLKQLQLKAKGEAFARLGVLSGPDMAVLEALTGDPTQWQTAFKGGANGVLERLKVFDETLDAGFAAQQVALGYCERRLRSASF